MPDDGARYGDPELTCTQYKPLKYSVFQIGTFGTKVTTRPVILVTRGAPDLA
jgi:hypothetical protein